MKILSTQDLSLEKISRKLRKPQPRGLDLEGAVRDVMSRVRMRGDRALLELAEKFDGVKLGSLTVGKEEVRKAYGRVDD
ncbi:MAG: histidinol dehydrogenase, partial [Proteobacteria bacterium]|nr:histidinol dehydrogenase [Pseudomonadota bacterium]